MKKISKKILSISILIIILMNNVCGIISEAFEIGSEDLICTTVSEEHLKYYDEGLNLDTYATCNIIGYNKDNSFYPAYCINQEAIENFNINEIINRDDIWRVIKNGYPYKSFDKLNVSNEFNAYTVTKFAINCLLGELDVNKFSADENDQEAVNMLTSLKNLVNIGINGTENKSVDNISIEKDGNLVENGDYYIQKYNVNSDIEMNDYNISKLENFAEECYVKKLNNTSFELYIPKGKIGSKVCGYIDIESECKTYQLNYLETDIEGISNYALISKPFELTVSNLYTEIDTNTGKIKINKIDEENLLPISNVIFELYKDEILLDTNQTNDEGIVFFENLYPGQYLIKEAQTDNNYYLNSEPNIVNVTYNNISELTITNKPKKGRVKITKIDKDNKEIKIPGGKFNIYNKNNQLVETVITNEKGEAITSELPLYNQEYYVKEIECSDGYFLSEEEIKLNLESNKIVNVNFESESKKGNLEIISLDTDTKTPIQGIEIELYDKFNKKLGNYITDNEGKIYIENLKSQNDYYIKEVKTLQNYQLLKEKTIFNINYNETTKLEILNEKIKSRLKVVKLDKDDNNVKLEGVKFDIYDEKNNFIEKITTDKEGEAYSSYLPSVNRVYTLVESETIPGYAKNEEFTFLKLNKFEDYELVIENEKVNLKEEEKELEKLEEVEEVKDVEEKNEKVENFYIESPKILPKTGY